MLGGAVQRRPISGVDRLIIGSEGAGSYGYRKVFYEEEEEKECRATHPVLFYFDGFSM